MIAIKIIHAHFPIDLLLHLLQLFPFFLIEAELIVQLLALLLERAIPLGLSISAVT